MEPNCIDVHQHVVPPFPAKALPSSRRRSLRHRNSARVAKECDELRELPKKRNRDSFADRAERRPLEQTRSLQDEIGVEFVAPAATDTDEALVMAAKSGNHSAFVELWKR